MSQWNEHMGLMAPFDCFVPKHHRMYHLLLNCKLHGNPTHYATWADEGLIRR